MMTIFSPLLSRNRLYGLRCQKCGQAFGKHDYVMRAKDYLFHPDCFSCVVCNRLLVPGDEFSIKRGQLYCKDDHWQVKEENNNNNSSEVEGSRSSSAAAGELVIADEDDDEAGGECEEHMYENAC